MQLWNKLNKEELEEQLRAIGHEFMTISFYQYAQISNPHLFRDHLFLIPCSLTSRAYFMIPPSS